MNDMTTVCAPRSDQINADTLIPGPMTVTIKEVIIHGGTEQPVSMRLEETPLFFRPCKSMSRCLVTLWGADAKQYTGRSLTLYRDPSVKWAGMEVGGIRISHMSHIDREHTMALTASKGNRKPFKVLPLVAEQKSAAITPELADAARTAAMQGEPAYDAFVKACSKADKQVLASSGVGVEMRTLAKASAPPTPSAEPPEPTNF